MKTVKIISERVFKAGYVLRKELVDSGAGPKELTEWTMAYNLSGKYIGEPKDANFLAVKMGIRPEVICDNNVCSIGFSSKDGKWYGWSHRAIYGFKIGSLCKRGDCHYRSKKDGGRGQWTAKTVADARQMAVEFAESVS